MPRVTRSLAWTRLGPGMSAVASRLVVAPGTCPEREAIVMGKDKSRGDASGDRFGDPQPIPEGPESTPLSEGLRKGIDLIDTSTPPVDEYRPALDGPAADPGEASTADAASDGE